MSLHHAVYNLKNAFHLTFPPNTSRMQLKNDFKKVVSSNPHANLKNFLESAQTHPSNNCKDKAGKISEFA